MWTPSSLFYTVLQAGTKPATVDSPDNLEAIMKSSSFPTVLILAFSVVALTTFTACGKKNETETETKTVIIEKQVETPTTVTREVTVTEEQDGHLERAGKKIEEKAGRKFDRAVDSALD
jgi:hypothetical protein